MSRKPLEIDLTKVPSLTQTIIGRSYYLDICEKIYINYSTDIDTKKVYAWKIFGLKFDIKNLIRESIQDYKLFTHELGTILTPEETQEIEYLESLVK